MSNFYDPIQPVNVNNGFLRPWKTVRNNQRYYYIPLQHYKEQT